MPLEMPIFCPQNRMKHIQALFFEPGHRASYVLSYESIKHDIKSTYNLTVSTNLIYGLDSIVHIESVIKEKGSINGGKAYFVAELQSENRLRIKTAEVLAEQPW
jgi:hypothetical protein